MILCEVKLRKNAFLKLITVSFLMASLLSVTIIRADVPSVLQINVVDSKIVAEIRHSSPSSSHYVEKVEVRIGNDIYVIDLDPQTEVVFEIEIVLEDVDLTFFEVRVRCTIHGWSSLSSFGVEETTEDVGRIPGFPVFSVLVGVALLIILQKTRIPLLD